MLSKFAHKIYFNKKEVVIFNSIVFSPIIISNEKAKMLFSNKLETFSNEEINFLHKKGILVKDNLKDIEIENMLFKNSELYFNNTIDLLYIIPAGCCNLACKYCFIGKIENDNSKIMEQNVVDNIIKNFSKHLIENNKNIGTIIFYGGEPTINFNLIKYFVNKIKEYKDITFKIAIVTNSTLIDDNMLYFFKKNNISLGVSIDGPKYVNDKNRIFKNNNNSVYDDVLSKIRLIKEKGVELNLSITISEYCLDNQDELLNWLKDLDVKNINFNLMHYTEKTNDWKLYYKKVSKFLFTAYDYLKQYNIKDDRLLRKIIAFYNNSFKFNDCGAIGGQQLTVKPNGDLTICHGYWNSDKETCGNINKNNFNQIINTDLYKKWKNNLTIRKEKCLKCPAIQICGGGCAMQSDILFGKQTNIDKSFCIHTKYTLKELLKRNLSNKIKIN